MYNKFKMANFLCFVGLMSLMSLVTVTLSGKFPSEDDIGCEDVIQIGNDAFVIFSQNNFKKNWDDANDTCKDALGGQLDGSLAVLSSPSHVEMIRERLMENDKFSHRSKKGYWVGCSSPARDCDFKWLDNSEVEDSNATWFSGQPDCTGCPTSSEERSGEERDSKFGTDRTDCCQLWNSDQNTDDHFKMDDACCTKNKHFICQFRNGISYDRFTNCTLPEEATQPIARCPAHVSSDEKVVIQWPTTFAGRTVEIKCPNNQGSDSKAQRECKLRAPLQAVWGQANTTECIPESPTRQEENLKDLVKTTILPEQTKKIAKQLTNFTSASQSFDMEDLMLSVKVIEKILESGENGTSVAVAEDVLTSIDNMLNVSLKVLVAGQKNDSSATRLIEAVERLSLIVNNSNGSVSIETPNYVMAVTEIGYESFSGLDFFVSSGMSRFSRRTEVIDTTENRRPLISLPTSLFDGFDIPFRPRASTRAQFVVHKKNTFFKVADNSTTAGFNPVIAASIGEIRITNLTDPVKITIPHKNTNNDASLLNISCVFWDFSLNAGDGAWSGDCCVVSNDTGNEDNTTVCECNHLTNFALLVDIYGHGERIDSANRRALSIISYIGCGISLLALLLTIVSLIACKKRKDKATKILINLCFALCMALLMFLIGSFAVDFSPIARELCTAVAVLLHFFLLAALMWMALEALHLYFKLVRIFEQYISHFMVKFCLFGWGVPLVFVIITLAVDIGNYGYHNTICWLSRYPFYGAFLAPLCLVIIFNFIVFSLVIYKMCGLNSPSMTKNSEAFSLRIRLRAAIGVTVLLGLTWVFAIFAVGSASLVFNYLFAIFNSLQGLFIFIFHCAMKKEIRNGWNNAFCIGNKAKYHLTEGGPSTASDKSSSTVKSRVTNRPVTSRKTDSTTM
ncbi:adhesion G-protein coupled receptor G6-like [Ptychodera flava]|uniref:adhesion G-protein coupled receptor G6-like n=1 Tax=Ptychodera flava TaxID=63121 RepID=UPI003969D91C